MRFCASSSAAQAADVVDGQNLAVLDHLAAVDIDGADGAIIGREDERADRVMGGAHGGMLEIDEHEIGAAPGREAADVVAPQGAGAAQRSPR